MKQLFEGSGVIDWLVQRATSLVMLMYVLFWVILVTWFKHIDFVLWKQIFSCNLVKSFTLLALFSLLLHAWIGIWTVLTDYISCIKLRLTLHLTLIFVLIFYLGWGIYILWGGSL